MCVRGGQEVNIAAVVAVDLVPPSPQGERRRLRECQLSAFCLSFSLFLPTLM